MQNQAELTGLTRPEIEHDPCPAMHWMTAELVDETIRVWSPVYGRQIDKSEAVEILRNVKALFELITE
jgi:hypothetical protein